MSRIAVFGRPSRHQTRTKSMTSIFHTRPTPFATAPAAGPASPSSCSTTPRSSRSARRPIWPSAGRSPRPMHCCANDCCSSTSRAGTGSTGRFGCAASASPARRPGRRCAPTRSRCSSTRRSRVRASRSAGANWSGTISPPACWSAPARRGCAPTTRSTLSPIPKRRVGRAPRRRRLDRHRVPRRRLAPAEKLCGSLY